jgi:hypothetical protein
MDPVGVNRAAILCNKDPALLIARAALATSGWSATMSVVAVEQL